MIFQNFHENSHYRKDHFQENRGNHISIPNIINLPSSPPSGIYFEREKWEKVAAGGRWGQIDNIGNVYTSRDSNVEWVREWIQVEWFRENPRRHASCYICDFPQKMTTLG